MTLLFVAIFLINAVISSCIVIPQAASQTGTLPEETDSSLVTVTGPANRLLLTKEILDFCGALPIYYTEHTKVDPSNENGTASKYRQILSC